MNREDPSPAEPVTRTDEGFLRRWSRRKQEARTGMDVDGNGAVPGPSVEDAPSDADSPLPDADPLPPGDEDMPPVDSLGPDSDVSVFFSPRVSETLRRAALRRIFHQPAFNVTDGLDDYCADYRHMIPLGSVVTADMRLKAERAKDRLTRLTDGVDKLTREGPEPDAKRPAPAADDREEPHGNA